KTRAGAAEATEGATKIAPTRRQRPARLSIIAVPPFNRRLWPLRMSVFNTQSLLRTQGPLTAECRHRKCRFLALALAYLVWTESYLDKFRYTPCLYEVTIA